MKRLIPAAAVLSLLQASPIAAQVLAAAPPLREGETLLLVEAEGYAEAMPDTLRITSGVVSTGSTAAEALAENNRGMQRILAALAAQGVSPEAVSSVNLSLEPQYPDDRSSERDVRIIGYTAENDIEIAFDDFAAAERIISALFDAGANQVRGPNFSLQDEARVDAVKAAAERDAVRRARLEADNYAKALGMRVARILRVSDRALGDNRYETRGQSIRVTGSRIPPTPLRPEPIEVESEVYIEFALVPEA